MLFESLLEKIHGLDLGLFGDVNVWFHGFIVAVAGPFHYDLRGYSGLFEDLELRSVSVFRRTVRLPAFTKQHKR